MLQFVVAETARLEQSQLVRTVRTSTTGEVVLWAKPIRHSSSSSGSAYTSVAHMIVELLSGESDGEAATSTPPEALNAHVILNDDA